MDPPLSPFFLLGVEDFAIRDRGRQSGDVGQARLRSRTAGRRPGAQGRVGHRARGLGFRSLLQPERPLSRPRCLGLGVAATVSPENDDDWNDLLGRLADTVHLILLSS